MDQPPSLQKLVEDAGAWHLISPQAWGLFYVEMERWKTSVRYGDRYLQGYRVMVEPEKVDGDGTALVFDPETGEIG